MKKMLLKICATPGRMQVFAYVSGVILLISFCSQVSVAEAVSFNKCCGSGNYNQTDNNNTKFSSEVNIGSIKFLNYNSTNYDLRQFQTNPSIICHTNKDFLTELKSIKLEDDENGFFENGFMRYADHYYSPQQYCIKEIVNDKVTVKVEPVVSCDAEANKSRACIKKCCGPLEAYDLSTYGKSKLLCVPSFDKPWDPIVYSKDGNLWKKELGSRSGLRFESNHPRNWCSDNVVLWSMRKIGNDRRSLFRILENGSILKRVGTEWEPMNTDRICLEGGLNFGDNSGNQNEDWNALDTIILECGPTLAIEKDAPTILYGTALAISSIFLLATLIVYGLLWDKQNLHGWTLLGYVTTLFLFYLSCIITYFYLYHYPDADFTSEAEVISSFCGIIAVVTCFLWISSICWLTVICFDIFAKFRILKLTRTRSKNKLKFLVYFSFTIIVPLTIITTGVLLDITYGDDLEVNLILPRFGWNKCFLDLKHAAFPYLFGPIGTLLVLNCILYLATIFYMHRLQESTKFAANGANNSHIHKQRAKMRLFSKLFILMGISWIFEFVSFLWVGSDTNVLVIVVDMINILQPIAVFLIFVCKRDILESLCQKYSTLAKIFSTFEIEEFTPSTSSNGVASGKLAKFWNPVASSKFFRSRINSTTTDTSNVSNQSIRSALNAIVEVEETPLPSSINSNSPLKI